jgi:hypothetical protein
MKKKILIGVSILILLLIVTNPSANALKDHLGIRSTFGIQRKYNFFLFSIYTYDKEYIGIIGNFIGIDTNSVAQKQTVLSLPYKERVYAAMKDNVPGFDTSQQDFLIKLKDRNYALQVYDTLKSVLTGFNKTPNQFLKAIND